jgi:hypothetical protein
MHFVPHPFDQLLDFQPLSQISCSIGLYRAPQVSGHFAFNSHNIDKSDQFDNESNDDKYVQE